MEKLYYVFETTVFVMTMANVQYLLLGQVLIVLLLLHSKLVVHLLTTLADVLAFAEVVDVGQALPWLPLRLSQDVFDLRVILV